MDIYKLTRDFWDFAFENTGKIKPIHVSIYFFALEHCNRLGWKKNFGLPTSMVLEAISVKSYSVYKSAFDDLVNFGLFEVIQYSKNQYSSNIIALKENNKANTKADTKALDKALIKHSTEHSTKQPLKQHEYNNTNIQDTNLVRSDPNTHQNFEEKIKPIKSNIEIYKEYSLNAQNENYKSFINVLLKGKNNSGAFSKLLTLEPITESKYNIVVMQLRGSGMTPDEYENILEIMEGHISISKHTDLNSYLLKFIQNHKKRD